MLDYLHSNWSGTYGNDCGIISGGVVMSVDDVCTCTVVTVQVWRLPKGRNDNDAVRRRRAFSKRDRLHCSAGCRCENRASQVFSRWFQNVNCKHNAQYFDQKTIFLLALSCSAFLFAFKFCGQMGWFVRPDASALIRSREQRESCYDYLMSGKLELGGSEDHLCKRNVLAP